jgi:hypothetical protein
MTSRRPEAEFGDKDRVCLVFAHSQRGTVEGEMSDEGQYHVRWDDDDTVETVDGDDIELLWGEAQFP